LIGAGAYGGQRPSTTAEPGSCAESAQPRARPAVREAAEDLALTDKRELRRERWAALRLSRSARFPGAAGRIPNFTGAEEAARILAEQPAWERAKVLVCNQDLAQRPVRLRALRAGKRVFVPTERLSGERPFRLLDPRRLDPERLWEASSIRGAEELGRPVALDRMERVDLVVVGAVAAAPDGSRLGRGGGYADLEHALLCEAGLVSARTPVLTTLHATQVLEPGAIPMERHDLWLDGFATPAAFVSCARARRRACGILWSELDPERLAAMPAVRRLARARATRGPSAPRRG
jgi:5-formyltetrahydrofolate cyclo-ligase